MQFSQAVDRQVQTTIGEQNIFRIERRTVFDQDLTQVVRIVLQVIRRTIQIVYGEQDAVLTDHLTYRDHAAINLQLTQNRFRVQYSHFGAKYFFRRRKGQYLYWTNGHFIVINAGYDVTFRNRGGDRYRAGFTQHQVRRFLTVGMRTHVHGRQFGEVDSLLNFTAFHFGRNDRCAVVVQTQSRFSSVCNRGDQGIDHDSVVAWEQGFEQITESFTTDIQDLITDSQIFEFTILDGFFDAGSGVIEHVRQLTEDFYLEQLVIFRNLLDQLNDVDLLVEGVDEIVTNKKVHRFPYCQ
ncbi:hypothetical protein Arash_gp240 [Salmonella phage Arash]|nr:hypothetical protein Arash_gp240 [Salmonella phage Arash]